MAFARYARSLDPFQALARLQQELESAIRQPRWRLDVGPSGRGAFPPINVFGDEHHVVVRMEVPGVAAEAIEIKTQGRTLTVSGKRELSIPEGASLHRCERGRGEFSRSIELPADLDLGRAEATCKHGLLTIRIPRREEAKPRTITIQGS
jgi:HSP20 family protein